MPSIKNEHLKQPDIVGSTYLVPYCSALFKHDRTATTTWQGFGNIWDLAHTCLVSADLYCVRWEIVDCNMLPSCHVIWSSTRREQFSYFGVRPIHSQFYKSSVACQRLSSGVLQNNLWGSAFNKGALWSFFCTHKSYVYSMFLTKPHGLCP